MAQLTDQRADEGRGRGIALHPLDPLTPDELATVVTAARRERSLDQRHLFVTVQLDEPPKETVIAWDGTGVLERVARVVVWDQQAGTLAEGLVSVAREL